MHSATKVYRQPPSEIEPSLLTKMDKILTSFGVKFHFFLIETFKIIPDFGVGDAPIWNISIRGGINKVWHTSDTTKILPEMVI